MTSRTFLLLVLLTLLYTTGCGRTGCPEGFLQDNDGTCLQVGDDDDATDDDASDDDDDASDDDDISDDDDFTPPQDDDDFTPPQDDDDAAPDEPDCESHDSTTCSGGDVHWVDSCGDIEGVKEECDEECLESGDEAVCADVGFRCWDTDYECYELGQILIVDFECEARNQAGETVQLLDIQFAPDYSSDASDIDEFLDDQWDGSLNLSPGSWTDINDTFRVAFDDDLSDEELELEADIEVGFGGQSTWLYGVEGDGSRQVEVLDGWFCF